MNEREWRKRREELWRCDIPECERGAVKISKFSISQEQAALQMIMGRGRHYAGDFTSLKCNGRLWMSDTPKEHADHADFFHAATGHVLIHGLGLGCCLSVVAQKPGVDHVTVTEINPDVISLVAPHFAHFDHVDIIEADAMEWRPPPSVRFGAVWHDIWADICETNLDDMKFLHRRYGRKTDWQASWAREQIRA